VAFFEAMQEWREHPEKFLGRPKFPKYKHKTAGRNLLVYEKGAISKRALKRGRISLSALGELVPTKQRKEAVVQARVVPRATQYVIEVVYERKEEQAAVDTSLFAALDLGVTNLAAITSNKAGFEPLLVNGRGLKAINQWYNKQREHLQKQLAKINRFTSHKLDALTDKRNRRINHQLHYKAELVGIRVIVTEESYTSQASFLDRDEMPVYDPVRTDKPQFSGWRDGRWYRVKGRRPIHSDVNGSVRRDSHHGIPEMIGRD
jgi:putative transposase